MSHRNRYRPKPIRIRPVGALVIRLFAKCSPELTRSRLVRHNWVPWRGKTLGEILQPGGRT